MRALALQPIWRGVGGAIVQRTVPLLRLTVALAETGGSVLTKWQVQVAPSIV
jgi:hypothetical protein